MLTTEVNGMRRCFPVGGIPGSLHADDLSDLVWMYTARPGLLTANQLAACE